MTQYPYPPPTPYATPGGYSTYGPPPRPTSVTAIAIIGIIWGAFVLLCNSISMVPYVSSTQFGPPNPVIDEVRANATLQACVVTVMVIRLLLALVLLVGSIAALGLHEWGRKAQLVYGWGMIALSLLDVAVTPLFIFPILDKTVKAGQEAVILGTKVGIIIGVGLGLIYPICVLYFMTRKHVKDAFAGIAPAVPAAAPYGYATPYAAPYAGSPYSPPPPGGANQGQGPYSQ